MAQQRGSSLSKHGVEAHIDDYVRFREHFYALQHLRNSNNTLNALLY